LFLANLPDGWVKPGDVFQADCIAKDNGKTNHDGKHEFHGCFRDSVTLARDVRTAIALQLYQLLEVEGYKEQLLADFEPRPEHDGQGNIVNARPWMDWYLIPGFGAGGHRRNLYHSTSGVTQRNHFHSAAKAAGVELKKGQATHARRHHALKTTGQLLSRQAKARYGGWSEGLGRLERHYEDPLEWSAMAIASGHPKERAALLRDRWAVQCLATAVADEDLQQPFSFIDKLAEQLDDGRQVRF
jgi:hypothetical protein